jgi:GMP synthase (glutamine-hydrolysing)
MTPRRGLRRRGGGGNKGGMTLKFLIVEGNSAQGRAAYRVGFDRSAAESYADKLRALASDAACDIVCAADAGASAPAALADYDAVFITGSALNLYDGGPEVERQIELARAVFAAGAPFFGSCWGLQVACAAAGGHVFKNPRGREIGVARNIWPTEAGRAHPLLKGRPPAYDALCSHIDIVALPQGGVALASNAHAPVQAAEIVHDGGVFWGVQYHPEYEFAEVAAIVERRAAALAREGLVESEEGARAYARDLRGLDARPSAAWRLGLGADALTPQARALELANFIAARVRPLKSARGRG